MMFSIEKITNAVARWLNWLSAIAIVAVMLIVCINVLSRSIFGIPLKGTVDIVSQLGVIIIACALAYTQVLKGHIRITLFIDRVPNPYRTAVNCIVDIIGIIMFAVMSWQTFLFAKNTYRVGELSEVLKIPLTPFAGFVTVGSAVLTLVLFVDLLKLTVKEFKK